MSSSDSDDMIWLPRMSVPMSNHCCRFYMPPCVLECSFIHDWHRHVREPPSLRNCAQWKILAMIDTISVIPSLYTSYSHYKHEYQRDWRNEVKQMEQFLEPLPSGLFNEMAVEYYKRRPYDISLLLIPKLRVLECADSVRSLFNVEQSDLNIERLQLNFDVNDYKHYEIDRLYNFISSLRNLTHIKISNCCTDKLLEVLGEWCPHLKVFDALEDYKVSASNAGLKALTDCTNLTHVYFNDTGDEYDYEDNYVNITSEGIANFLQNMKQLRTFVFEESAVRKAIVHLWKSHSNVKLPLGLLRHKYSSFRDLHAISDVCGSVSELQLDEFNPVPAEWLAKFHTLQGLSLTSFSLERVDLYHCSFVNLKLLELKLPKTNDIITGEFFSSLGTICKNLKELRITLAEVCEVPGVHNLSKNLFPSLEDIHFRGQFSSDILYLLSSIPHLYCLYLDCAGNNLSTLLEIASKGSLQELSHIYIDCWLIQSEFLKSLVSLCPNLKHINIPNLSEGQLQLEKQKLKQIPGLELESKCLKETQNTLEFFHLASNENIF